MKFMVKFERDENTGWTPQDMADYVEGGLLSIHEKGSLRRVRKGVYEVDLTDIPDEDACRIKSALHKYIIR